MVAMLVVVVVLRDARRAYKLHTIASTPFSASLPPTHVSDQDYTSTFTIDLFNAVKVVLPRKSRTKNENQESGKNSS